jgi:hypothetical protein
MGLTAAPIRRTDSCAKRGKAVSCDQEIMQLHVRIAELEAALKACNPALDIAMEQAHPRQRDHWHKIMIQVSEALTSVETKGDASGN